MSYSWFRVDGSFSQHPKTLALQAAVDQPLADAYLIRLWSWVHCYAPTGIIPSRVTEQIESAIGWRGERGLLVQAMTEVGFLDHVADGISVHDWRDYQAIFAEKAKKDAAKKRQRRRRAVTPSVTPPSRVTAPPTRRDETRRDETRLDSSAGAATDPRHAPMVKALVDRFELVTKAKYPFTSRDAKAVTQLLALGLEPTILAAWDRALRRTGFPATRTLPELVSNFAHFVGDKNGLRPRDETMEFHEGAVKL